jgi:hypothetical protein
METFDEIVDKKLEKEDIKNTQFMLLIKYRDNYNKATEEEAKKTNLSNFRKLYEKIKDSLTPDEDEELVESLSDKMLKIYYEDISEPDRVEPEPEPEPDEESNQELGHLRVLRHIKTLGKASEKLKKSRKKKRKKSRKKKSKKRRRSKTSKK